MNTANVLTCPNCGTDLTEALAKQLREQIGSEYRQKYQESVKQAEEQSRHKLAAINAELEKQRLAYDALRQEATESSKRLEKQFDERLKQQASELAQKAEQSAREKLDAEVQVMRSHIEEQRNRLSEQTQREMELRKANLQLEEKSEHAQLEMQRQLSEERTRMREQFEQSFLEQSKLREAEKDKKISDMQKLIDDLQMKSQQGSQQTQGEVLELQLENELRSAFLFDDIQPVPKGKKGGDVIHRDIENGMDCGIILWEFKRTKSWNKDFIPKLKEDVRELKAGVAVIVGTTLPDNVDTFTFVDGVWICHPRFAIALANVLREGLIEVSRQRVAGEGKNEKMDLLYHYLTGQEFANHMQSMMEIVITMRKELDDERRAIEKIWAKREKQITLTQRSAIRIRGDLEGIIGNTLPPVSALQLPESDPDQ